MPKVTDRHIDWFGKGFVACIALLFLFLGTRMIVLDAGVLHGPISLLARAMPIKTVQISGVGSAWYGETRQVALMYESLGSDDPFRAAQYWIAVRLLADGLATDLDVHLSDDAINEFRLQSELASNRILRKEIITPYLQLRSAEDVARKEGLRQDAAWRRVEGIQSFLELGIAFSDLAKQYSDYESSANGGYMGEVAFTDVSEVIDQIRNSDPDEVVILETDQAYEVVKVHSVLAEEETVEFSVIGIYKEGIEGVLQDFAADHPVRIF